jgi:hypothetical protein
MFYKKKPPNHKHQITTRPEPVAGQINLNFQFSNDPNIFHIKPNGFAGKSLPEAQPIQDFLAEILNFGHWDLFVI